VVTRRARAVEHAVVEDAVAELPSSRWYGVAAFWGVLAVLGIVAYLLAAPLSGLFGSGSVWPRTAVAVGTLDGHDVAVVAYDLLGDAEVAAYDTVTGERLWHRDAGWQPRPLGAGTAHVIVRDDQQLSILDLRDGAVVVEGADIAGLDLPHGELNWWEEGDVVDPAEGVVYVSTHDGFPETRPDLVRALPLGGTEAVPLTERQAKRWGCYIESADAHADRTPEPVPGVTVGGVERVLSVPAGKPAGTPRRQLLVDGVPRGMVYPLGSRPAGVLTSTASGTVARDVCDIEWPGSADAVLAPDSGVVAAVVGMDVESRLSRIVLLDADTGVERHRVDDVREVTAARTTPSGGAVLLVEIESSRLFGLTSGAGARLVLVSPVGEVTEVSL